MPPSVGVPVMTSVNIPLGVPPPPPHPAKSKHANAAAAKVRRKPRRRRIKPNAASSAKLRIISGTRPMKSPGHLRCRDEGGTIDPAVTVTVDDTASTPSSVMLEGESVQVASTGAPVQVRFTV